MVNFTAYEWTAGSSFVTAYAAQPKALARERPAVVFLHGALRNAGVLAIWADLLADEADVFLLDLPGHGRSPPIDDASVSGIARVVHEALGRGLGHRPMLLAGESLGGTVALAIGGMAEIGGLRVVFAADPPITTGKLWSVQASFAQAMTGDVAGFPYRLGRDTFGIYPDGPDGMRVEEIIYYSLLGELVVPAVIATGDVPLLPRRPMSKVTSLFDPVDQFVAANLYADKVSIRRIAGCGHLLLTDAREACLEILRELLTGYFAQARIAIQP